MPAKLSPMKTFTKGILKENPVFRMLLGTCPALAVTTLAINGLGMGLAIIFVLVCSNVLIALIRKAIPSNVRIPVFITIIASFVTIVQLFLKAYVPALDEALGIFIPLITVNCIILARAEAFASRNTVFLSALDGLGMGLGATLALVLMGSVREVLGNGTLFGLPLPVLQEGGAIQPMLVFILPPGGFFVFGILIALSIKVTAWLSKKEVASVRSDMGSSGCAGCMAAGNCPSFRDSGDACDEEEKKGGDPA